MDNGAERIQSGIGPESDSPCARVERDPVEIVRAQHYSLLSVLLTKAPDAATLALVAALQGGEQALGAAHRALAASAVQRSTDQVEREYFRLFIGVGRGELVPYGSYYQTGFLQEKPLARLRGDLAALGIERSPDLVELEDHVGILCEIMAGLIDGRFGTSPGADKAFFAAHLATWIERFFADLEAAEGADFYKHVGGVGAAFLAIESKSLALAA